MNEQIAADIFKEALMTGFTISAPVLAAALFSGLIVSLLQSVMQLHEVTLTFVPKLIAVFIVLIICMPWMLQVLESFTVALFSNIPNFILTK